MPRSRLPPRSPVSRRQPTRQPIEEERTHVASATDSTNVTAERLTTGPCALARWTIEKRHRPRSPVHLRTPPRSASRSGARALTRWMIEGTTPPTAHRSPLHLRTPPRSPSRSGTRASPVDDRENNTAHAHPFTPNATAKRLTTGARAHRRAREQHHPRSPVHSERDREARRGRGVVGGLPPKEDLRGRAGGWNQKAAALAASSIPTSDEPRPHQLPTETHPTNPTPPGAVY